VEKNVFDLKEAAEFLARSKRWVREQCASGAITHSRMGKAFRFERSDLEEFVTRRKRKCRGVYA
jgi:excisionase family DNA binding protein